MLLVGGVGVVGLGAGGWYLLREDSGGPKTVAQQYADALTDRDVAALNALRHQESPSLPEVDDLSGVQEWEISLEDAQVVNENIDYRASNYSGVQEFELVEYVLLIEADGESARAAGQFVVAKNQNGEWKLWDALETPTGLFQTQAEDTGTESTEQVADNLDVITKVGVVGPDNTISELRLGVRPAESADEINLAELTLQYVSDDDFANVIVGEDASTGEQAQGDTNPADIQSVAGETNYLVTAIVAETDDDIVMTERDDRYEIVVPLSDDRTANPQPDLSPLEEGMDVEITITTEAGAQVVSFMEVPDSLAGMEPGENVDL
jgi:flagellin FlaB